MAEWMVADVGGTNTRIALASPEGLVKDTIRSYPNAGFASFTDLVQEFLTGARPSPWFRAICAGVAGPVRGNQAQLTNHSWNIDAEALGAATGAQSVHLMNDLQAQGFALDDLSPGSVTHLFPGAPPPDSATRLVMGLGTGCNIAVVYPMPYGHFVPPSETGHTSLPDMDGDARALIEYLAQSHYHKPIEAALSGPGLARIFRYLSGQTLPAPDVVAAFEVGDIEAKAAMMLFTDILGTVAGNIALTHLPMGGFYFIGGTARAVAPHLAELGFHAHFTNKGPYAPIVQDIPIFLIDDDTAALTGCARHLRQSLPNAK